MFNDISVIGITPLEAYPCNCSRKNCKQNIKCIDLRIPCSKPDIESINDIKASICVDDFRVINTILGKKIVLNLSYKVKVVYTALNTEQSVHSAHWSAGFCDFILDREGYNSNCYELDTNIFVGLEDVYVHNFDGRSVEISLVYIICNTPKCEKHCSDCGDIDNCGYEKKVYMPKRAEDHRKRGNLYYCQVEHYEDDDKSSNNYEEA